MKKPGRKKAARSKSSFGIAEWYGELYRSLDGRKRRAFLAASPIPLCPFLSDVPDLAPKSSTRCSKKGGVCSLRRFTPADGLEVEFGPITATCPNRFHQSRTVIQKIGQLLLDTENPLLAKEIAFLRRSPASGRNGGDDGEMASSDRDDVGKIDLVFLHPDREPKEWCAVEFQAVYFSGAAMSKDANSIRESLGDFVPMPGGKRHPDFRSSGPKRLMPQLQIKVPSLRRWGKKMVVVVDKPFLDAMSPMAVVDHISNCDIVWIVIDYEENLEVGTATLFVRQILYTTLEDSVVGLIAGIPATLPDFEARLALKAKAMK